jgi:hypothetical protein
VSAVEPAPETSPEDEKVRSFMSEAADAAPHAACAACIAAADGDEPDMGDDEYTFAPGTCTVCRVEGIVFTLDDGHPAAPTTGATR